MSVRVLFVAGLGRSGTTLVERVLGELDDVCALGEVVHLWHRGIELDERCGCGAAFHDCPFWTAVGQQAFGGWDRVPVQRVLTLRDEVDRARRVPSVATGARRRGIAAKVAEYSAYYARLYTAAGDVSGARILVDSSKHPSLAFVLRTRPEIDLRVLHMVRDPRAVAFSWSKTVRRPEARAGVETEMWRYPPRTAAAQWNLHNLLMEAFRRSSVPSRLLRHEDFVAAPLTAVREVSSWAGLGADADIPVSATGVASLTVAHTVSGNPSRFATGEVAIRDREEWRSALPTSARRVVTALTLPLLPRYGYSVAGASGARDRSR